MGNLAATLDLGGYKVEKATFSLAAHIFYGLQTCIARDGGGLRRSRWHQDQALGEISLGGGVPEPETFKNKPVFVFQCISSMSIDFMQVLKGFWLPDPRNLTKPTE